MLQLVKLILACCRNGVVPDKKLYSVLISAVGSADPQAVLTMQEHLLKERVVGAEVRNPAKELVSGTKHFSGNLMILLPSSCTLARSFKRNDAKESMPDSRISERPFSAGQHP